ncbi:hypothetical protein ACFV6E_00395 [Streptomyces sp. NPDC059785]|uniref:hypothetical protein n=1 Tax=Streptomyces sp. NPDC059785 TaxID=3346945 RepID=UPI0036554A47
MLRITDDRTGRTIDAAVPRGLTRVVADVLGEGADVPSDLRVLLVADVLARALEMGGTPVVTVADPPGPLRSRALALGIRPGEPSAVPGGRSVHVRGRSASAGQPRDAAEGGGPQGRAEGSGEGPGRDVRVDVAPVRAGGAGRVPGDVDRADGDTGDGGDVSGGRDVSDVGGDVSGGGGSVGGGAVWRLALLVRPRSQAVELDDAALASARELLGRWRKAVAVWATSPSKPVPEEVRRQLRSAWEDDLDVPAVLGVLHRVESDPGLPDGARFETYAYADRLLGLELTRDIGTV